MIISNRGMFENIAKSKLDDILINREDIVAGDDKKSI